MKKTTDPLKQFGNFLLFVGSVPTKERYEKFAKLEEEMTDWSQEEASTSFSPEFRFRQGY